MQKKIILIHRFRIILSATAIIFVIWLLIRSHLNGNNAQPLLLFTDSLLATAAKDETSNAFYPHIAVLIESRLANLIVTVVNNVIEHIPASWPIQIFHVKTNEDFIRNSSLAPLIISGRIFLTLMKTIYDRENISSLLTTKSFWEHVQGEKVLFFQIDSIMCSNSPHKITDYLHYDYIGAPWDTSWFPYSKVDLVGNGGFSLRSRSKILALLDKCTYDHKMPEDVWYSQNLRRVNGTIAPFDVAKTFSVETVYYDKPLAVHKLPMACSFSRKVVETCPAAVILINAECASS